MDGRHPQEAHYYLSALGVAPEVRRDGVAAALIQPLLDRCDGSGTAAYLETGQSRSRDFFGRKGFEVIEEMELPGEGPPVWGMWREPTASPEPERVRFG
jgi:N-acetylglutamate synthase-like GNAT family acetyltransferase